MQALLNPDQRTSKITRFDVECPLAAGLRSVGDGKEKQIAGLIIVVPKGSSSARLGNFLHKEFLNDLVTLRLRPEQFRKKLRDALGAQEGDATFADLRTVADQLLKQPDQLMATLPRPPHLSSVYRPRADEVDNAGPRLREYPPAAAHDRPAPLPATPPHAA